MESIIILYQVLIIQPQSNREERTRTPGNEKWT
jgi:hypothetical protein